MTPPTRWDTIPGQLDENRDIIPAEYSIKPTHSEMAGASVGWCSAQRILNPVIAGGNHTLIQMTPPYSRFIKCGNQIPSIQGT